jgi:hypothetical protein
MTAPTMNGLIARVKGILLSPNTEWPIIANENTTARDIYLGYVAPLAAIGAIATFIGQVFVGFSVPLLGTVRVGVGAGLTSAILMYAMTFVGVFVLSWIVDMLAPSFGGQRDPVRALRLVAYSYTPAWIAGILHIVPTIGLLILLASLYGLYLIYLGLPVMMRCPKERTVTYTVVIVVCAIVFFLVIGAAVSCVSGGGFAALGSAAEIMRHATG